jgi:heme oxygenase (biliverdin-IX-beta and delta-forming)
MPLTLATATVAQVVKKETAFLHQEVEQILIPCLNDIISLEDYAAVLQCFYSYYLPIEQAIQQHVSSSILPDIERRRTALLIVDDLAFLGMPVDETKAAALPQINNIAQAFGVLYVLEGSTLGGKVIAKMLAKNPALPLPPGALNFFNGYKDATGKMWTNFVEVLNQQQDVDTIVHAANQTFYYLKNWMQQCLCYESKN